MKAIQTSLTDVNVPQEVRDSVHLHQTKLMLVKVNEFLNTARHTLKWLVYILVLMYLIIHMVRDDGSDQKDEAMTRLIYKMAHSPGVPIIDHRGAQLLPMPINGSTPTMFIP